jgi:hypothetical protein
MNHNAFKKIEMEIEDKESSVSQIRNMNENYYMQFDNKL